MSVVFPLKADALSVEGKQAMVGDGDAMRVAAQIPQYLQRVGQRGFGINHPASQMESAEQLRKLFRIGKDGCRSVATQFSTLAQPLQASNELAAEHFSKHGNR